MLFTLEALQANDGDCLLLHYRRPARHAGRAVLIDGGSRRRLPNVLKPRLDQLRGKSRCDLRMVMVSHIDADHITGILDLLQVARASSRTTATIRSARSGRSGTTRSSSCTAATQRSRNRRP